MDGKLVFIGGGPKRELWGGAEWEGLVQSCRQSTEEGSVIGGRRRGGDSQESDRSI